MMNLVAKLFGMKVVDISDCPFEPSHIEDRPILVLIGNKALVG